jgi:hypothetical protein
MTQLFREGTDRALEPAPGGGRTHNLWLRRPTLYPVELRARETAIIIRWIDNTNAPCFLPALKQSERPLPRRNL